MSYVRGRKASHLKFLVGRDEPASARVEKSGNEECIARGALMRGTFGAMAGRYHVYHMKRVLCEEIVHSDYFLLISAKPLTSSTA